MNNLTTSFKFKLINERGAYIKVAVSENCAFYGDFLNLFCGLFPQQWLDSSSHNKIILCDKTLKSKVNEICSRYLSLFPKLQGFLDFISIQKENSYLAFIRIGAFVPESERLSDEEISFRLSKFTFLSNYQIETFGDKPYFAGPSDLKKCICRFCGKSVPGTRFAHRNAHAIPECIGNKLVFCNDECMECNKNLSYIDKEIGEYLKFRRSSYEILNKRNKIIQVIGHNFDYNGETKKLRVSKFAIRGENKDSYYLKLEGADPISHLGIYKALAKIGIDLMPRDKVDNFKTTVEWIARDIKPYLFPDVYYFYRTEPVSQPKVKIFNRKDDAFDASLPRCIVQLDVTDLTFFYIVPLADGENDLNTDALFPFLEFLYEGGHIKDDNGRLVIEKIDMSDRIGKFSHVYEWVKKEDCEIVDQSVFTNQEKNPNMHDFPEFDKSKIKIKHNQLNDFTLLQDSLLLKDLHIFDVIVKCKEPKINVLRGYIGKKLYINIKLDWQIKLINIQNQNDIVSAEGSIICTHKNIEDVIFYYDEGFEISSHLIEYLLEKSFCILATKLKPIMPEFEFDKLAAFVMETNNHIMHYNKDAEQTVIPKEYLQ